MYKMEKGKEENVKIKSQFKNTLNMHRPECVSVCVLAKINK